MTNALRSIRARRHPRAIVGVFLWQAAVAWATTWPAVSLIRATYADDPRGDAALFAPGSLALLDFLSNNARAVTALLRAAAFDVAVGAVVGLLPMTALLVALADRGDAPSRSPLRGMDASLEVLPAMAALLVFVTLAQALVLGAGVFVRDLVVGWTNGPLSEARSAQLGIALVLPFVFVALGLGLAHDLARAAVVRTKVGVVRALVVGMETFLAAPASVGWSWFWRSALAWAPVIALALLAEHFGAHGAWALASITLLHQAVVLLRVALKASWFAHALRRVGAPHAWADADAAWVDTSVR